MVFLFIWLGNWLLFVYLKRVDRELTAHAKLVQVRMSIDAEYSDFVTRSRGVILSSPLAKTMSCPPRDLRDAKLRELFDAGHFGRWAENWPIHPKVAHKIQGHLSDPKLELAAYLMTRTLHYQAELEVYCPALSYKEFHRYQAMIHKAIDQNLGLIAKRWEAFWNDPKLSAAHKQALRAVFFDNEAKVTRKKVV